MMNWERVYYDAQLPGSYGGVQSLSRATKKSSKKTLEWLKGQDSYTLHKPVRYTFPRRRVIAAGVGHQWQCDLIDTSNIARYNQGIKFVLTCIDVFSKKAFVVPLKNKTGKCVLQAFKSISAPLPFSVQTDKGKEFLYSGFQDYLKENNSKFFTSGNDDLKASVIERFNRTLKSKLWRYFTRNDTLKFTNVLQDIVESYNNSIHRSTGMRPNSVLPKHAPLIWDRLYPERKLYVTKIKVGDKARISKARRNFRKGYLPQWTDEIFTVNSRLKTNPPTFKLVDYDGEILDGSFYDAELQVISKRDDIYKIEKVLKREKNRVLVKWLGYPAKFNSWISKKALVS